MLDRLLQIAERASRIAVWAGGAMLIFSAFMVTFDVIARKFFAFSLAGADEISGYLFAISTAWALSFTLLHRVNVRIDALYMLFPQGLRALADLLGLLLLGGFVALLTYRALFVLESAYVYGAKSITPLQTPLAIPQTFWVVGLLLFLVTFALVLLRCLVALFRRDLLTLARTAGVRSLDEEVEAEVAAAEHEHARHHREA